MTDPAARVLAALDRIGADYQALDCDPALADTETFCRHYGYAPEISANTIVVAAKGGGERRHVACVVLAHTRLDVNRTVRKRLGVRRASFAGADETLEATGMMIGGVTVFGLPADMPVWIDARVMDCESVILGGGSRSLKIRVAPEALTRLPNTEVVDGLANEAATAD
jgi:prolyl-tRNA editing enzyme YbaK/EbsC (Cys-tRNA(Pro) deacylase)